MSPRTFFERMRSAVRQAQANWRSTKFSHAGDWEDGADVPMMSEEMKGRSVLDQHYPPMGQTIRAPASLEFDPEEYTKQAEAYDPDTSISPAWFMKQVEAGHANVARAFVFEAKYNSAGKMWKEAGKKTHRIVPVYHHDQYMLKVEATKEAFRKLRETNRGKRMALKEDFGNDTWNGNFGPYDPNQYTEYAPMLGGYFFAQMYLSDMLKQMAYAFEAWNHNPIAHRAINALAQYTLGRRFDWHVNKKAKDFNKKEKVWEEYAEQINLRQRLSKFWIREKHIFGEQMINKKTSQSLHPATVWEIVTDPTDITNVYYYYRSYPTQYQMYTGFKSGGGENVKAQDYIIEQIPYSQLIHIKGECTSFEKRGRSTLFPVLGWLKRIKDLYNSKVTKEQMNADYAWDVTVKGGPSDVTAFMSAYSNIPKGSGNQFVHNEAVKREVISASQAGGARGSNTGDEVLAFIATGLGFPKDFFNIIATGGGSRATALVAAEPFTKVIEDGQADVEFLLHELARNCWERAGLDYDDDDIEFTFPSITKDTTSEAVANIQIGEQQGYISKETAGSMYAQEMGITTYDYEEQQGQLKNEQSRGDSMGDVPVPAGRNGSGADDEGPENAPGGQGGSDIHGSDKTDLQDNINNL
jgi:hypothetical protein